MKPRASNVVKSTAAPPRRLVRYAQKGATVVAGALLAGVVLLFDWRPEVEQADPPELPTTVAEAPLVVPEIPVSSSPQIEQAGLIEPPGIAKALKLFATYPGPDSRVGRAVLGAAEASSRTYVVGALLENGATLSQVFNDRAVLLREGRTYTLYLPSLGNGDPLEAGAADLTVGDFAPPQAEVPASAARVTDVLRTVPAYAGDVIVGFAAYPGLRREQFDAWGLQSGDVLVSAGGYALNDVAQMEAVSERLAAGAVLVADVQGDSGERRKVTLDGSALLAAAASPAPAPFPIP